MEVTWQYIITIILYCFWKTVLVTRPNFMISQIYVETFVYLFPPTSYSPMRFLYHHYPINIRDCREPKKKVSNLFLFHSLKYMGINYSVHMIHSCSVTSEGWKANAYLTSFPEAKWLRSHCSETLQRVYWKKKTLHRPALGQKFPPININERLTISARAEITFPSVVSDLLMFAPSCDNETITA